MVSPPDGLRTKLLGKGREGQVRKSKKREEAGREEEEKNGKEIEKEITLKYVKLKMYVKNLRVIPRRREVAKTGIQTSKKSGGGNGIRKREKETNQPQRKQE